MNGALQPNLKNKIIFAVLFNIFMLSVFHFSTRVDITWRLIAALIFITALILSTWLPKTFNELDEREKELYFKYTKDLNAFFSVAFIVVLSIHIIFYQNMSVIEFAMLTGAPTVCYICFRSLHLKKVLNA